jgi:hypothetical protein
MDAKSTPTTHTFSRRGDEPAKNGPTYKGQDLWGREIRFGLAARGVLWRNSKGPSRACDRCEGRRHASPVVAGRTRCRGNALAVRTGKRVGSQLRLAGVCRGEVVVSFQLAASPSCAGQLRLDVSPRNSSPGAERRPLPSMPYAWARRNSDQLGPLRRGAGPRPDLRSTVAIVVSVPAAKRLRPHRKAGPAPGRKRPAHRSEQRPVGGRVVRPLPSAAEDRELMAQHHDLKLPLSAATGEQADTPAQDSVQQRHQHDEQSEPARPRSPAPPARPNRISLPHRHDPH